MDITEKIKNGSIKIEQLDPKMAYLIRISQPDGYHTTRDELDEMRELFSVMYESENNDGRGQKMPMIFVAEPYSIEEIRPIFVSQLGIASRLESVE